jgi:anti-anti-sigma factor
VKIERQQIGSVEVSKPVGPLVDEDAEAFSRALMKRLVSSNPRVVVVLKEVPYLDSVALEGLADASDELSQRAMQLKLVNVQSNCREVLELTGLADRFQFFDDVQDAVKSFL